MIYKSLILSSLLITSSFSLSIDVLIENKSLSLEKVINLSLKNDPSLQKSIYIEESFKSKSKAAKSYVNPKISFNLLNVPIDTFDIKQESMTQFKIGISQVFPRGNTLELKEKKFVLKADVFPYKRENEKIRLILKITNAYLESYKNQELINILEEKKVLLKELVSFLESSYSSNTGKIKQENIIKAQIDLSNIDDKLTLLFQKKESSLYTLSQWFYTYNSNNELENLNFYLKSIFLSSNINNIKLIKKDVLDKSFNAKDLEKYFDSLPLIKSIEKSVEVNKNDVLIAKESLKAQFMLSAAYAYRPDAKNGNERSNLLSAGFTIDLPLFSSRSQEENIKVAKLNTQVLRMKKREKMHELMISFKKTKNNIQRLKKRNTLYKDKLLIQVKDQIESSLYSYNSDNGSFLDLIKSKILYLNLKSESLKIKIDIQKNIININYFFANKAEEIITFKGKL
ncbi:MAG: TolC family protein [Campylobacteraceae bacterium]|nr:TolC family protein [Campylobacteraceae bacterium]